jgi:hypothetical protein
MNKAAIQDFWTLFSLRADALSKIGSAEDPVYDEILAKLHEVHDGLFFEFSTKDGASELIITAEGERALFGLVDDIVASAPKVQGWSYVALKPKLGLARSITWEGHVIDCAEVVFEPLEDEKSGDFGIRLLVPDLAKDKEESAHNGLLRVLDHALGERRFADEIRFTEVSALDGDADDYIPLSALDRFIDWRKEQHKKKTVKKPKKKAQGKPKAKAKAKAAPMKKAKPAKKPSKAKPAKKAKKAKKPNRKVAKTRARRKR